MIAEHPWHLKYFVCCRREWLLQFCIIWTVPPMKRFLLCSVVLTSSTGTILWDLASSTFDIPKLYVYLFGINFFLSATLGSIPTPSGCFHSHKLSLLIVKLFIINWKCLSYLALLQCMCNLSLFNSKKCRSFNAHIIWTCHSAQYKFLMTHWALGIHFFNPTSPIRQNLAACLSHYVFITYSPLPPLLL